MVDPPVAHGFAFLQQVIFAYELLRKYRRRDRGQCVQCGSTKNLHFDHDIPFSKGGSGLTAANVRLLCAKHNLEKSDKILSIASWIFAGAMAVPDIWRTSG
jgi:hypothetical protein